MPANYNPPYDSPIEEIFARHYIKYASVVAEFIPQVRVKTLCGEFVVDFVIRDSRNYRVGIECDGKAFHDEHRDEWRDAMILGDNHLDVIYRIRGSDLSYYVEDVLYLLVELEPSLFDPRAAENLRVLASPEIIGVAKSHDKDMYRVRYRNDDDTGSFGVEARRRIVPDNQCRFWQSAYRFAVSIGGGRLDDVMIKHRLWTR